MWLPETAADDETLEVWPRPGIKFTILAPRQARRVRRLGDEGVGRGRRRHRSRRGPISGAAPAGRRIALFFYDGPISRAVAFERLLRQRRAVRWPASARASTTTRDHGRSSCTRHRRRVLRPPPAARRHGPGRTRSARWAADPDARRHQLRRVPRAHPPDWEVEIRREQLLELRPRRRALAVATAAARRRGDWQQQWRAPLRDGARLARGAARPALRARGAATASPTPGRRATPTST